MGCYPHVVETDLNQLPIPDWGLRCQRCGYLLRGLPSHRCPECGDAVDVPSLIRTWGTLRPPRITGRERPLPDVGLRCAHCEQALAGLAGSRCTKCGTAFELEDFRPRGEWIAIEGDVTRGLPQPLLETLLAQEAVPYVAYEDRNIFDVYMGSRNITAKLLIRREFYFEVLWLIQTTRRELAAAAASPRPSWLCPGCGEPNPGNFELCWSCQLARP